MRNLILLFTILTFTPLFSQWNTNKAVNNMVVTNEASDHKSIIGSNYKTYIAYWQTVDAPVNYELRLQIIGATGRRELGANGVLISDSIPMGTYTSQWSFTLDENNNAYIGVTGTSGNLGFVFKTNNKGENLYGKTGISLGSAYQVKCVPQTDGNVMISWLNGSTFAGSVQKFSASGQPIWESAVEFSSEPIAQVFELSDQSQMVISHQLAGGINSIMKAQKISADGELVWDESLQLFDDTYRTVYNRDYSMFMHNDNVYISYKVAHNNRFDSYIQKITHQGELPWGITGIDFDIQADDYEQETVMSFNPESNTILALCRMTDANQGQVGVAAQTIDMESGERLFGDNAKELFPLTTINFELANILLPINSGMYAFVTHQENGLKCSVVDENGDFYWSETSKDIATFDAAKGDVHLSQLDSKALVATFSEDKGDGEHIYAQIFGDPTLNITHSEKVNLTLVNPITNRLIISGDQQISEVTVVSLNGKQVLHAKANDKTFNTSSANWRPGAYIVSATTLSGSVTHFKVVKQ